MQQTNSCYGPVLSRHPGVPRVWLHHERCKCPTWAVHLKAVFHCLHAADRTTCRTWTSTYQMKKQWWNMTTQCLPLHHGWFAAAKLPPWQNVLQSFVSVFVMSLWYPGRGVSIWLVRAQGKKVRSSSLTRPGVRWWPVRARTFCNQPFG